MQLNQDARRRMVLSSAVAAVLAIGALARLGPFAFVFGADGVRFLGDDDAVYHALRAERLAQRSPDGLWFDTKMNHPKGATILWPPGWDGSISLASRLTSDGVPHREHVAKVAAIAPVLAGLVSVALVIAIAWTIIGAGGALFAGTLFAVLPAAVSVSTVGRPDHHAAELAVFLLAVWAFLRGDGWHRRAGHAAVLGIALAAGPWVWQGSTLHLAVMVLAVVLLFVARGPLHTEVRAALTTLRDGSIVAALLVLATLASWGPPGFLTPSTLNGVSILHPIAMVAAAIWCALALSPALGQARTPLARAALAVALAVPLVVAAAILLRGPLEHALTYLGRPSAALQAVTEMQPALFGSRSSFGKDLAELRGIGIVLIAPVLASRALFRRWRSDASFARSGAILLTGCVIFGALFLKSFRFYLYLTPFLVLSAGLWLRELLRDPAHSRRARSIRVAACVVAALLFVAPAVITAVGATAPSAAVSDDIVRGLRTVRSLAVRSPGSALAPWPLGHSVQYYAGVPVLVTPFATDIGEDGLRDAAAFFHAPDVRSAEAVLRARDVRFAVITGNQSYLSDLYPYAPPDSPPLVTVTHDYWGEGRRVDTVEAYGTSIPGWLYEFDGVPLQRGFRGGLDFLRLVHEIPAPEQLKFFQRVEGARVLVRSASFTSVAAHVDVQTNLGRRFHWWTPGQTDSDGLAVLRVPYGFGRNGDVFADLCVVRAGGERLAVRISDDAVLDGATVVADFTMSTPR